MANVIALAVTGDGQLKQLQDGDDLLVDNIERKSGSGNLVIGSLLGAVELQLGSISSEVAVLGDLSVDGQMAATLDMGNQDIIDAKTISYEAVGSGSGTGTLAWNTYQKYAWTISAAATLTFTAPAGPCNLMLRLINGGTGTITWPSTVAWPGGTEPTWTTSGSDLIGFFWDGTTYWGAASMDLSIPP